MRLSFGHARTRAREAIAALRSARQAHGASYPALVARFADLYARRLYSIAEIRALDLLDPRLTRQDLDHRQSKEAQLRLQLALNPLEYLVLTHDKAVFQVHCQGAQLPRPRHFGVLMIPPRSAPDAVRTALRAHAERVLSGCDVDALIVKPARGVYGQGIAAIRVMGAGFARDAAPPCSAGALFDSWDAGASYLRYVVQQRLYAHADIARLSGTRSLQTVRMVSYVARNRSVVIGCCQLRIVVGDAVTDNFRGGRSGNLLGDIPNAAGVVTQVFGCESAGSPLVCVPRHPQSGVPFKDFRVPRWSEACRVVTAAALAFAPLRTIGWDVAITDEGVFLIEGNATWDPAYEGEVGAEILDAIRADANGIGAS